MPDFFTSIAPFVVVVASTAGLFLQKQRDENPGLSAIGASIVIMLVLIYAEVSQ